MNLAIKGFDLKGNNMCVELDLGIGLLFGTCVVGLLIVLELRDGDIVTGVGVVLEQLCERGMLCSSFIVGNILI